MTWKGIFAVAAAIAVVGVAVLLLTLLRRSRGYPSGAQKSAGEKARLRIRGWESLLWSQNAMCMNDCFSFELIWNGEKNRYELSGYGYSEKKCGIKSFEKVTVSANAAARMAELLSDMEFIPWKEPNSDWIALDETTSGFEFTDASGVRRRCFPPHGESAEKLHALLAESAGLR